jgi:hypothetical protein
MSSGYLPSRVAAATAALLGRPARGGSVLLAAGCVIAVVCAPACDAGVTNRCNLHLAGSRHADSVDLRDKQAVVFTVYYGLDDIPTVVGCAYSSGRVVKLAHVEQPVSEPEQAGVVVDLVRLSGDVVAYPLEYNEQYTGGSGADTFRIAVKRLTDGKTLLDEPNGQITPTTCCSNDGAVGYGPTQALVLASDGAVAWITREDVLYGDVPDGRLDTGEFQVHVHDRNGNRVLDTSTHIAPGSLRLAGHVISWTDSGSVDRATLS